MRIGVISDTHIPKAAQDIPRQIYREFKKVDLILHAGDLVELSVIEKLKKLAPVKAVCGNMDEHKVRAALPEKEVISLENGIKIGLIHGFGSPHKLIETVRGEFSGVSVLQAL